MKENTDKFKSYLKEHKTKTSLLLDKIEGTNSSEITLEEKALLRTTYDSFLNKEKSELD